ncbi:MAG: PAS domain-containing protein, partial [Chloroflexi bacterium]|nr:PAS domain-containing protein [Chloroflexota bacterium]
MADAPPPEDLRGELERLQGEVSRLNALYEESTQTIQRLQQDEDNCCRLFEKSLIPITVFDSEARIVMLNPMGAAILGHQVEDCIGRPLKDFIPEIHELTVERVNTVLSLGKPIVVEDDLSLDSQPRWFMTIMQPVYNDGDQVRLVQAISYEVTAQTEAIKVLEQHDEQYRLLFERAGVAIGHFTTNGEVISLNSVAAKALGGEPEDFTGKTMVEVFGAENGPIFTERVRRVVETGEGAEYEELPNLPSGPSWHLSAYTPISDDAGRVASVQVVATPIDQLKRAQQALEEEEARLSAMFHALPSPSYLWEVAGDDLVLVDYNEQAKQVTYGRVASLVGKRASEIHSRRPDILADLKRCAKEQVSIKRQSEFTYTTTEETVHLKLTCAFAPPNHVLLITEDITEHILAELEHQASEARYRTIVENFPNGLIALYDRDLRYTLAGGEGLKAIGMTSSDLEGKRLRDVFPPDVYERDEPALLLSLIHI